MGCSPLDMAPWHQARLIDTWEPDPNDPLHTCGSWQHLGGCSFGSLDIYIHLPLQVVTQKSDEIQPQVDLKAWPMWCLEWPMKKFANDGCFDPEQLGPVSESTLRAGQIFRWAKTSGTFGLVYHQPSATSGFGRVFINHMDFTRIWDYIASKIRGYSKQYIAGWWLHWIIFQHGGHWVYVNYLLLVGKCGCVRNMLFFHQPSMCHFSWETDDEALDSGDSPSFRQTDDVPFWSPAVARHRERRRGSQDAECLQNFQGPALADEHHGLPVLWLSKTRKKGPWKFGVSPKFPK